MEGLSFTSKSQVRKMVIKECPEGGTFEVFLDAMPLWCCNPG